MPLDNKAANLPGDNTLEAMPTSVVLATREGGENMTTRTFSITGNNKGLWCPFKPVFCQKGYCLECQIYLDWLQERGEMVVICAWCGKEMSRKPGLGETGISHGICAECDKKWSLYRKR